MGRGNRHGTISVFGNFEVSAIHAHSVLAHRDDVLTAEAVADVQGLNDQARVGVEGHQDSLPFTIWLSLEIVQVGSPVEPRLSLKPAGPEFAITL